MRKHSLLLLAAAACAAGLIALALASPPARRFYRFNHVRYLLNDQRPLEAMREWEALRRADPRAASRHRAEEAAIIEAARAAVASDAPNMPDAQRRALIDLIGQRPELAPVARRLRLEDSARGNRVTSATLPAALAVLERDGYSLPALWWAAMAQYDPARPLDVPPVLPRFRETLNQPIDPERDAGPEPFARNVLLRALVSLADRDWARAANQLEDYFRLTAAPLPVEPALAIALMRAGEPDRAAAALQPVLDEDRPSTVALVYWTAAQLRSGSRAWAGQGLDRLANSPGAIGAVLGEAWPQLKWPMGRGNPLAAAGARLLEPQWLRGDARLWSWLAERLGPDASPPLAESLQRLTAHPPDDADSWIDLVGGVLSRGDRALGVILTGRLAAEQPPPGLDPAQAAGLIRLLAAEGLTDAPAPAEPVARNSINLLLTNNTTVERTLPRPGPAAVIALDVSGYPRQGVWPMLHFATGNGPGRLYYATGSRDKVRTLILLTPAGLEPVRLSISLLNGHPSLDRTALIQGARWF
jgi:hypothetical protein